MDVIYNERAGGGVNDEHGKTTGLVKDYASTFLSHLLNMYCIVLFKLNSGQHWKMHVWHIQGFCSKQVFISSINHTDTTHFHYNALSCQGKLQ